MPRTPCANGDYIRPHPYHSINPGMENIRCVGATHLCILSHTTPHLDVAHSYDYFQLSHAASSAPHHNEFNNPRFTHPSCLLFPTGSERSDDIPTACRNLGFPQPSQLYNPWGSFQPPPGLLPIATCDVSPPTLHLPTLGPTLYLNSSCPLSPWSVGDLRVGSADEVLPPHTSHDLPSFSLTTFWPPAHPHLDDILEPYNGSLEASYPCLWTKDGVICNVMVEATRSYMNRHLHAYHGFGGSDARQTRCYWTGCGAMMQQGSIARHIVTCHLQVKVTCPMCSKKLSRQDVISKHRRVCPAAGSWR